MAEGGYEEIGKTAQDVGKIALSHTKSDTGEIRIILIGKIGVGKSSTANTIIGSKIFESDISATSVTLRSHHGCGEINGRKIVVIDTPGLFDTGNTTQSVLNEIKLSMRFGAPGVHAVIIVLSTASRFTEEDKKCFEEFSTLFGKIFFDYVIVVFTWADRLAEKQKTLEQYVGDNYVLKDFLTKCKNRKIAINNNEPKPLENEQQRNHLFNAIMRVIESNNDKYYTDKLFEEAEIQMKKKEQKILKDKEKEMNKKLSKIEKALKKQYKKDLKKMERQYQREKDTLIKFYEAIARSEAREKEEEEDRKQLNTESEEKPQGKKDSEKSKCTVM